MESGILLDDELGVATIEVENDVEHAITVDDVANEEIVEGIVEEYEVEELEKQEEPAFRRQYAASTLRTNDFLRARPRMHVPPGRTPYIKNEESDEEPPRLSDPDGSLATPSMKKLFRMYSDASLRKADSFFQAAGTSTAAAAAAAEVVEEVAEERSRRQRGTSIPNVEANEELVELIDESGGLQEGVEEEVIDEGQKDDLYYDSVVAGGEEGTVEYDINEFDWPLYSEQAIDFPEACDILMGNIRLPEEKVCKTTPHEYKGVGTFIVDWSTFMNRHDIGLDGFGSWGKPSGRTRYYRLNTETNKYECVSDARGQIAKGTAFDIKCQLKKYEHPTTTMINNGTNRFIKKIISCISKEADISRVAIVTYEWIGTPFDFSFLPAAEPRRNGRAAVPPPPEGARSWEAASFQASGFGSFPSTCTAMMGDCPLYSMGAIQFHDVCNIIMGATVVDQQKVCDRIPQRFRECGTFVIDVEALASEHEMRRDDNGQWGKPAGNSRYYKLTGLNAIRLDRSGKLDPGTDYDLQILCKRYEHPLTGNRFVRKIYTGRTPLNKSYHQTSMLAVITYFWKGEPIHFENIPQRKVRMHNSSDYEMMKRDSAPLMSSNGMLYEEEMEEEMMEGRGRRGGGRGGPVYLEDPSRMDGRGVIEEMVERRGTRKRKKSEGDSLVAAAAAAEQLEMEQRAGPSEDELQWTKMALVNQERFGLLLDRFEGVAEKMERMAEMQMNMMMRQFGEGREERQEQYVEEEEVYEEMEG